MKMKMKILILSFILATLMSSVVKADSRNYGWNSDTTNVDSVYYQSYTPLAGDTTGRYGVANVNVANGITIDSLTVTAGDSETHKILNDINDTTLLNMNIKLDTMISTVYYDSMSFIYATNPDGSDSIVTTIITQKIEKQITDIPTATYDYYGLTDGVTDSRSGQIKSISY